MTKTRYKAAPLSRVQIRNYAKTIRAKLGLTDCTRIDIVWLAEVVFPKFFAKDGFLFEILTQAELGSDHGLTDPSTGHVMIREDVYDRACQGRGRDRLTIAHELAHFLLHNGVTLGLARAGENENIPPYCDPEWQASAFAGEFLMDADIIRNMTVSEIAEKCGVSTEAAAYQKSKIK